MKEIHSGACGSHQGGTTLARKIRLQGYFWPKMQETAEDFVRKCETCQKFSRKQHRPATPRTPITSAWPFAIWRIDIQGPYPTAPNGKKFLIVAVDYFTKWVEAEPVARITGSEIESFL
ncbi:hypothetical protein Dimus_039428 [Dionaea muscipula]